MKMLSVLGVRPNFVKEWAIHRVARELGVEEVIVHTGQHYDFKMSGIFFGELDIPKPDYHLELLKQSPLSDIGQMISFVSDVIEAERPDVTLVYGDVDSTLAAALASARHKVPVAHVEAGLRSHSFYNPEEINRRVSDTLSTYLFPHIQEAHDSLIAENYDPSKVFLCGDVVYDALLRICSEKNIVPQQGKHLFVTLHRQENTDRPERLKEIVRALIDGKQAIRFSVHPRTERKLKEFGLWEKLSATPHIEILPPQSYVDSIREIAAAGKVLSDSGGVRREAYMLGKPVISLIEMIWVPSMVKSGWELVAGCDYAKITEAIASFDPSALPRPEIFGDGKASERIIQTLKEKIQAVEAPAVPKAIEHCLPANKVTNVSVVIPVYNEEDSLPELHRKLSLLQTKVVDTQRYDLEFVIVNDGSSDRSGLILDGIFRFPLKARIIHHEKNRGLGAAIRTGFENSKGDLVVTIDADSNYDQLEVPKILDALSKDDDMVTASPFLKKGSWNYPMHRFVMSRSVVSLYKLALRGRGRRIHTFTSGFRVYRKKILRDISPEASDFLVTAELLVNALMQGYRVKEYHTTIYPRTYGRSKLKTFRTIAGHLRFMWRVFNKTRDLECVPSTEFTREPEPTPPI